LGAIGDSREARAAAATPKIWPTVGTQRGYGLDTHCRNKQPWNRRERGGARVVLGDRARGRTRL